jgi:phosphatidylserine/phosphatidylglycerophosphate/cardiolipin synthase-like enzyme
MEKYKQLLEQEKSFCNFDYILFPSDCYNDFYPIPSDLKMRSLPAENFQILTPHELLDDVVLEAKNAQHRIWAQSMDVASGNFTTKLFELLEQKAQEELDTRLHVDYYSLLVTNGSFNYFMKVHRRFHDEWHHTLLAKKLHFDRLERNGVKILFTNPPGILEQIFPFKGRNHMKIIVIDNNAWIGGINFNDWNFNGNDYMVKLTDPRIVSHIATLFKKIDREEKFTDYKVDCTPETTLLVDSGKMGKSIILQTALDTIKNAKYSVFMTTAFFPDTQMIKVLHERYRNNVDVKVIAPRPRSMTGIYMYVEKANFEIMKLRKMEFPTKLLRTHHHAKLLIVDRQIAMFGSHNFSGRGVTMGTGEVAIITKNNTLIQNLLTFFNSTLEKP